MSEDKTHEIDEQRSFQERVFARFDSIDARFERVEGRLSAVEIRITELDAKQYDTRPIWEQALAAIRELQISNEGLRASVAELQTGLEGLRTEMRSGFADVRKDLEHSLRGVERKIDALNHNILELQGDQRYVDRRLDELESQIKPS